jgi:hypothetical protein
MGHIFPIHLLQQHNDSPQHSISTFDYHNNWFIEITQWSFPFAKASRREGVELHLHAFLISDF